ncbi:hypothetical protein D3C77_296100 [compost metagenome]
MTIPHDFYIKFTQPDILEDTLSFHCKGNFFIHGATQHFSTLHHIHDKDLLTLTGNELALYPDQDTSQKNAPIVALPTEHPLHREESCDMFNNQEISLTTLYEILSPLISRTSHTYKRGYPSGGALYPVELFCCNLNSENPWPNYQHIVHALSRSKKLESISGCYSAEQLHNILLPTKSTIGTPSVALIYFMYLPKALFKYRYRGYRLAILEAGSMYMLTDLRCKDLKLKNRMWSGFTDYQLTKALNLNPALFLPLCVQFIGHQG